MMAVVVVVEAEAAEAVATRNGSGNRTTLGKSTVSWPLTRASTLAHRTRCTSRLR